MSESNQPKRRSPLDHRVALSGEGRTVRLAEAPFLGKFILRADPRAATEALRPVFPLGLPSEPLTSIADRGSSALWMGPDEWMLVTAPEVAAAQFAEATVALAGLHHQLVDVSDYYTSIDVVGGKARELLMKLTTFDLHPRAFRIGMVTGSVFGRANAMIWQIEDDGAEGGPAFRLFIRWSMADYLWCLLADAGREWGVPEQVPLKGEMLTLT